ncbi:MAG: phosphoglucosamine mutase [Actinomycetia bacterium]|nr:phosphoglucosamine mutase [Actinomycetes bacterium]
MARFFGTDGVRGVAGSELTRQMAEALGAEAVRVLGKSILIGRDTRASGPELTAGLIDGVLAAGGQAVDAGVVPTPGIALLTRKLGADCGIVVSASHNPPEYNGIKFFDAQGYKLSGGIEQRFEAALAALAAEIGAEQSVGMGVGLAVARAAASNGERSAADAATVMADAAELYIQHTVLGMAEAGLDLSGLRVVVDCAHGAAYHTTPEALRRLGVEVHAINTDYDGKDINVACGSTHLDVIRDWVLRTGADAGFAHDGDADRVLAVDAAGNEVDGDVIEAICARDLKQRGLLKNNTVVSTVMSNLGFIRAMEALDIDLEQTDVGDSKVLAAMRAGDYVLGGEQSGHIIFKEYNTTGDGLVAMLMLLKTMARSQTSLEELAKVMHKFPQILINVKVADKEQVAAAPELAAAARDLRRKLSDQGRVLLRPSGTEPMLRVMVEAESAASAQEAAESLAAVIRSLDEG